MSGERLKAIFRKDRGSGDVIAFFPDMEANYGMVMSYEHNGQHGEASYSYYLEECEKCVPEDYGDLKRELEQLCHCEVAVIDEMAPESMQKIWKWRF